MHIIAKIVQLCSFHQCLGKELIDQKYTLLKYGWVFWLLMVYLLHHSYQKKNSFVVLSFPVSLSHLWISVLKGIMYLLPESFFLYIVLSQFLKISIYYNIIFMSMELEPDHLSFNASFATCLLCDAVWMF